MNPYVRDMAIGNAIAGTLKLVGKTATIFATVSVLVAIFGNPVKAQTPGHSEMHHWYKNLSNPNFKEYKPGTCCNERGINAEGEIDGDCSPAVIWEDEDVPGMWFGKVEYTDKVIYFPYTVFVRDPDDKTKLIDSPDGRAHICYSQVLDWVYCAIQGKPKG
jgi:hypothetical protein